MIADLVRVVLVNLFASLSHLLPVNDIFERRREFIEMVETWILLNVFYATLTAPLVSVLSFEVVLMVWVLALPAILLRLTIIDFVGVGFLSRLEM